MYEPRSADGLIVGGGVMLNGVVKTLESVASEKQLSVDEFKETMTISGGRYDLSDMAEKPVEVSEGAKVVEAIEPVVSGLPLSSMNITDIYKKYI